MPDQHQQAFSAFLAAGGDVSKMPSHLRDALTRMAQHESGRRGNAIRAIISGNMKTSDYKG